MEYPGNTRWVAERKQRMTFGLQVFAQEGDPQATQRLLHAGMLADDLGLDAFYLGDHPGYQSEVWIHLGALAMVTERLHLGSVVNCAAHRNPAIVARMLSDLDQLSNGRASFGMGSGWNEPEFGQLGIPFGTMRERQEKLDETMQVVLGMLGDRPLSFHGKHFWTEGGHVPPTIQRPRPPVIIAGSGEQVTLRLVAKYADACNFGAGLNSGNVRSLDGFSHKFEVLQRHCREVGRNYDDILRTHFTSWLMLAPTEAEAHAKRDRYYPNGMNAEQQATRIIGTPEQVTAYYQSLADIGFQGFIVQVLDAADTETMELLGREVAPRVRCGA